MSLQVWFWAIFVISLLFGCFDEYEASKPYPWHVGLRHLLLYVLVGILAWAQFGGPVK